MSGSQARYTTGVDPLGQVPSGGACHRTLGAMALGWAVAFALGLPDADRFTCLIEFSTRNVAVAATVALSGLQRGGPRPLQRGLPADRLPARVRRGRLAAPARERLSKAGLAPGPGGKSNLRWTFSIPGFE